MYYNPFGPQRRRNCSSQYNSRCVHNMNGGSKMRSGCPQSFNSNSRQYSTTNPIDEIKKSNVTCVEPNIHQQSIFLKHSYMGEIIIPENTEKGILHRIASINADTSAFQNFVIHLSFSCNIITSNAGIHLEFQIFRQLINQAAPTPVSSVVYYAKDRGSSESNTLSFFSQDQDGLKSDCCNYSVYAKIVGYNTTGLTRITAPVIACILDCD